MQQDQEGLKASLQNRLIEIQTAAFGEEAWNAWASGLGAVLELELNIEERNETGNSAATPSLMDSYDIALST